MIGLVVLLLSLLGTSWITLDLPPAQRALLLHDADWDGYPDALYVDASVLTPPREVSQHGASHVFRILDRDGRPCTYLYYSETGRLVSMCGARRQTLLVPANASVKPFTRGVIIGDAVVYEDVVYFSQAASSGILLVYKDEPVVIGVRDGEVVIDFLRRGVHESIRIPRVELLGGIYLRDSGAVVLVARALSETALIYHVPESGSTRLITLDQIAERPMVFTAGDYLYLYASRTLYMFNASSLSLVKVASADLVVHPVDGAGFITVESGVIRRHFANGSVEASIVVAGEVSAVDWLGSVVAVSNASGVYLYSLDPVSVSVDAPRSTYAGAKVEVSATGSFARVYIRVGGESATLFHPGRAEFILYPGTHELEVYACRGVYCLAEKKSIVVIPRPLVIDAYYPASARPYENITISLETTDELEAKQVSVACTLRDLRGRYETSVMSGGAVEFPAVPYDTRALIEATCGGGFYDVVKKVLTVDLSEGYLSFTMKLDSKNSRLVVTAVDKYTNETWDGMLVVEVDGVRYTGTGSVAAEIKLGEAVNISLSALRGDILVASESVKVFVDQVRVPVIMYASSDSNETCDHLPSVLPLMAIAGLLSAGAVLAVQTVLKTTRKKRPFVETWEAEEK